MVTASNIRSYELRLLRCSLGPADSSVSSKLARLPPPAHRFCTLIDNVVSLIEEGRYAEVLSSEASRAAFRFAFETDSSNELYSTAEQFYSTLIGSARAFIDKEGDDTDWLYRALLVMFIGVAAFLAFTQNNVTGPKAEIPWCPIGIRNHKFESRVWETWARNQLMGSGSDLLGKFSNLQYIAFAMMLLTEIKAMLFKRSTSSEDGMRTISWWLGRILLLQQKMVDEKSSNLFDTLQIYLHETIELFGSEGSVKGYWGAQVGEREASAIVCVLRTEAALVEHTYGRDDACRFHLESATVASGLELSLTGMLGFRTKYQIEPKAQIVLVSHANIMNDDGVEGDVPILDKQDFSMNGELSCSHQQELSEMSDILMAPRLLGSHCSGPVECLSEYRPLSGIQQLVILAQCLTVENNSRMDEMQKWDMAPYIEAINSQESSHFTIRYFCNMLRIRWESTRTRTKERALLMMDNLVQDIFENSRGVAQRMYLCYAVNIPTISALRKEHGELLVKCGLVGEAVKIFEELNLWKSLIFCYCLLEKKAVAVELIKKRLTETPDDPSLWCSLGDVINDDSCYKKALEASGNKSARAKRALARSAYNRGDYMNSKILWESAMAMNSLYPNGWFAFGAAALKARDVDGALEAFTRAVQLDPENGEAFNNIACLHMIKKRSKESFIAFKEALKFKRDSWQLWENYSHVSTDIGNLAQGLEAANMVLDLTGCKRVDIELFERLMLEMEKGSGNECSFLSDISASECFESKPSSEREHLWEFLGKIFRKIVKSGNVRAEILGLYARWHKFQGDLLMCAEALLKQVRSYQGSETWKDGERFVKFTNASIELCKVYMDISSSTGSRRELHAAEMHLRNIIRQAGDRSGAPEFRDVQACLEEVKSKLQPSVVASPEGLATA